MSQFCCAIFLLGISSLATAANLTLIYEWNELDYEFPSEASRTQALQDGAFYPDSRFEPLDMAAYGTRIFLSLFTHVFGIPVSLVSLPTWRASSAPPKLTPVPSWDMYGKEGCNKIEVPKKLEVDSVGRMWILDDGSTDCNSKIWTIDLINDDQTKLVHRFSQKYDLLHIVLDETKNETLAYVSRWFFTPFIPTTTTKRISWTSAENSATTEVLECIILKEKLHQCWRFIIFLLCSYVFTVIFLTSIIVLTQNRKNNALSRNTKEVHEMTIVRDKPNKEHEFPNNAYSRSFSPDLEAAEKAQYATDEECESDYFEAVEF
ncbi:uncharacterized protein LOC135935981 [Cloeon dipterum]|uniref:uncharacterized protein LOC135935981 n=1 Tax=Cloeon dipterum TaxID=197152 RepID=UPI00321F76E8